MRAVYFFIAYVTLTRFRDSESQDACQFVAGKRYIRGECIALKQCGTALSNLRAGVRPQICYKGQNLVCCPTEKRISEEKCEEYSRNKGSQRPMPFFPLAFQNSQKSNKVTCNEHRYSPYVANGRDALEHEYPHMVALGFPSGVIWKCGASLISEKFVLTAAHCMNKEQPRWVLIGDVQLKIPSGKTPPATRRIMHVEKVILHPKYSPPLKYHDIAIIKLRGRVSFSEELVPGCLPSPSRRMDQENKFEVAGWGMSSFGGSIRDKLQTVNIAKTPRKKCNQIYDRDESQKTKHYPQGIIRSQVCAGDVQNGNDTCKGDSGGPMMVNKLNDCLFTIVGITSFGSKYCGYAVEPGIYTNVQSYLNWIEDIVW